MRSVLAKGGAGCGGDAAVAGVVGAVESAWPPNRWANVTVLVGVSGGVDSVCLLRVLARLRPASAAGRLVVAHFNHRLRRGESPGGGGAGDEAFVRALADQLGCESSIGQAPQDLAADERSLRTARYQFFRDAAARYGARYLALGHTADDQAETALQRILRGTGLRGLGAMAPFRSLTEACVVARPLLEVRRRQIERAMEFWAQPYCTDETNERVDYTRNWLRHVALPTLRQRFPTADRSLVQLASQARQTREIAVGWAQRLADQCVQQHAGRAVVAREPLRGVPEPVVFELFAALWTAMGWPQGAMQAAHWHQLYQATQSESPAVFCLPGDLRARARGPAVTIERLVRPDAAGRPCGDQQSGGLRY